MRNVGTCVELVRMRPHDHIGWVFSGPGQFAALARPFLTEGAERGERLMFVSDDPDTSALRDLEPLVESGVLEITPVAAVYGESGMVDAAEQRATFAATLAEALAQGYTGIRVAADNTPLVTDGDRLAAWIAWETVADRFMSEHAVTGLCAFDREQVAVDTLRHLATLHPLCSTDEPVPQFRLISEDGRLHLRGEVNAFAVENLSLALRCLPQKTGVTVDLTDTVFTAKAAMLTLHGLWQQGVPVTIVNPNEGTRLYAESLGMPDACFADAS
jgi:hypothetical protein